MAKQITPGTAKQRLDFDPWLNAADRHLDPYILWTLQTGFRQFISGVPSDPKAPQIVDFIAELDNPLSEPPGVEGVPQLVIPDIYFRPIPGSRRGSCHVTLRLPMQLDRLPEVAGAIIQLITRPGLMRLQIGFPRPATRDDPHLPEPPPKSGAGTGSDQEGNTPGLAPDVVLGVLEDGCPFGHASLLDGPLSTRVAALWDQSTRLSSNGKPPLELGYGTLLSRSTLNALLAQHAEGGAVDEESLYADPGALQERLRDEGSHASAVITLMAGEGSRLPSLPPVATASNDAASKSPLVAVQFPLEQIEVAGARWLVVRALDGLRFICQAAADLAPEGARPPKLAINLSYGSVVGAHDGTALMETAMAELVESYGEMAMVLAAGNAYGAKRNPDDGLARLPSGNHAVGLLRETGDHTTFQLYVPPDKPIETYLELWFEEMPKPVGATQFLEERDVEIEVKPPVGPPLKAPKFPSIAFDADTDTTAGLLCFQRVAQSRLRSMALLVVAATQLSTTRVEAASGLWTVTVTNRSKRHLRVHGWVERDLVTRSSRSTQAARLLNAPDSAGHWAILTNTNTFNNIATGRNVLRVGALTDSAASGFLEPSPYSSESRPGQRGPELSCIADETPAKPGIRVSGNTSACVLRMNGTSVAAPQATRWLANELTKKPLSTIRKELDTTGPASPRTRRRGVKVPP